MNSPTKDMVSDLRHVYLNFSFEMKKQWKKKRIIIVVMLAIALPLIFYAAPPLLGSDYSETAYGFVNGNLSFISLLIILSAAMFTGDVICAEFENRTGLLLFPSPQRQNSIFIGKYIAALLCTWMAVAVYYLITMLGVAQIYGIGEIGIEFLISLLMALIYTASAVSVIFFFSAIMKRSITSTLVGFFSLMMIMPIVTSVLNIGGVNPWFIVTHYADLISDVLGTASSGGFTPGGDGGPFGGSALFSPNFYVGIYVMTAYSIGFLAAGLAIANRRKMEG